ncbi:MAG: hypothetical protein OXI20_12345, partial [Rhodospirillales bacterium]|nr:hypothetical protein [Rhodospirillales bacterium]
MHWIDPAANPGRSGVRVSTAFRTTSLQPHGRSRPCQRQGRSELAAIGADGRGEVEKLWRGEREVDRERSGPFVTHRQNSHVKEHD